MASLEGLNSSIALLELDPSIYSEKKGVEQVD